MKKVLCERLSGLAVLLALLPALLISLPVQAAAPAFTDAGFENTWNRVDKPVQDLPDIGRGYTWGPPAPNAGGVSTETYNGAARKVQYFDKARMEINNPNGNPSNLFYITTGLLVKELVTGNRQDGDSTFTTLPPSLVQVAGDTNEGGANPLAPTYASFRFVGTFFEKENSVSKMTGQAVTARIDKAGTLTTGAAPEQRLLKGYDDVTGHNIADVFEDYGNLTGKIWNGTAFVDGSVFFGLPLYIFGRPITEPYWVRTAVKGVEQDVLVQLFERRVLTYTPRNPEGFKVEMGNVGQHYYRWRYELNNLPAQNPTKAEFVSEFGQDKTGLKNPYYIAVDSQDNFYVSANAGNQIYKYDSQGQLLSKLGNPEASSDPGKFDHIIGMGTDATNNLYVSEAGNHRVQKFDAQGHVTALWVIPKRNPGDDYYPRAMTVDAKGNVYLLDHVGIIVCDNRGFVIAQWNNPGPADNQFNMPSGIGVDAQGTVYILDNYNIANQYLRGTVKKFDAQGHFLLKWDAGSWPPPLTVDRKGNVLIGLEKYDANGKDLGNLAQNLPKGVDAPNVYNIAVDQKNNIYVAGNYNSLVSKLDSTGKLLANFSTYGRGDGSLRAPFSIAIDSAGYLYVYDGNNYRIQKFAPNGNFLLKWGSQGTGDGQFNSNEVSLGIDDQGNVYAADPSRQQVQKFDSHGLLLLKIGQSQENSPCQGLLYQPSSVAVDNYGNIFIVDAASGPNCIEKFDREGHFLLQWGGYGRENGRFISPNRVVTDRQGHVYVGDEGNYRIQQFDAFGKFLQSWGGLDAGTDQLLGTTGVFALDGQGNFYNQIYKNNPNTSLGKFDSNGKLLYKWSSYGSDPGQISDIIDLSVDNQGTIYVVDRDNNRVEKFRQS